MAAASVWVRSRYRKSIYIGMFSSRVRMRGALRVEGDTLVLDYRERWRNPSTLRLHEGQLQRASAPCASIAEIEIAPRFFGGKWLILREVVFEALRGWPGVKNGVCRMHLIAGPQQPLSEAATELALAIAEAQLRAVEENDGPALPEG